MTGKANLTESSGVLSLSLIALEDQAVHCNKDSVVVYSLQPLHEAHLTAFVQQLFFHHQDSTFSAADVFWAKGSSSGRTYRLIGWNDVLFYHKDTCQPAHTEA